MKKVIGAILAAVMTAASLSYTALAADGKQEYSPSAMATWTENTEFELEGDLLVDASNGYNANAYLSFNMSDDFDREHIVSAKLYITANEYWRNKGNSKVSLYGIKDGVFENKIGDKTLFQGANISAPITWETDGVSFVKDYYFDEDATGRDKITQTYEMDFSEEAQAAFPSATGKTAAFMLTTDQNPWLRISTAEGQKPKLVIEFDDPNIPKCNLTVNFTLDDKVIKSYEERVIANGAYSVPADKFPHIRKNDTVIYMGGIEMPSYSITESGEKTETAALTQKEFTDLVFFRGFCRE